MSSPKLLRVCDVCGLDDPVLAGQGSNSERKKFFFQECDEIYGKHASGTQIRHFESEGMFDKTSNDAVLRLELR